MFDESEDDRPEPISLRHAVDLLQVHVGQIRKLGQEDQIQEHIPMLIVMTDELETIFRALGSDLRTVLSHDPRLTRLLEYCDHWKKQIGLTEEPSDTLTFDVFGSRLLSQRRILRAMVRALLKEQKPILVELARGELRIESGEWLVAVPARFEAEGRCPVRPIFIHALLDHLQDSELLTCRIAPDDYRINRWGATWKKKRKPR